MAQFQSHQGVHFYKKYRKSRTSSGTSRSPLMSSFLWKPMYWCDWNRAMSLGFEKYVAKGVIGDLFCRSAFYQWGKLKNEKWNIDSHVETRSSEPPMRQRTTGGEVTFTWRGSCVSVWEDVLHLRRYLSKRLKSPQFETQPLQETQILSIWYAASPRDANPLNMRRVVLMLLSRPQILSKRDAASRFEYFFVWM